MSKPDVIFDVCLEYARESYRASARAVRPNSGPGGGHPAAGMPAVEYGADFELAGRRVLKPHPRRLAVFLAYYCYGVPYREAIAETKLKPGTFDWYCAQIKKTVGRELDRVGLFPPRVYRMRSSRDADS